MIVVDTSVWIEFFKGTGSSFDRHLTELIRVDAPIALTEVIYCEVLQGIQDDAVHAKVRAILQAFPVCFSMDCGRLIEQSLSIGPADEGGSRFAARSIV